MILINKSKKSSKGFQIYLAFSIAQHVREEQLMVNLIPYLMCGDVIRHSR